MGYYNIEVCQLKHLLVGTVTGKVFHVSFLNLLGMLLMTSSWTSSIITEKKTQNGRFTVIFRILRQKFDLVGALKSFLCILPKSVMHVTSDQFTDKFNNGRKKMADLLRFFAFYFNNLILWAR